MVEHAVQRSLGRSDDSAAQGFEARGPLPFSAATDRQRGFCIHWVNLADTLLACLIDRLGHYLSANFAFTSRSLGSPRREADSFRRRVDSPADCRLLAPPVGRYCTFNRDHICPEMLALSLVVILSPHSAPWHGLIFNSFSKATRHDGL
jgi:hypothetical protein